MKSLLIYDSMYGNTEKIAHAILEGIHRIKLLHVSKARLSDLSDLQLLIIGSPTQRGQATVAIKQFLDNIPLNGLKNMKVAAFDTRFREADLNFALKLLVKTIGYAAPKIANALESKGGTLIISPEGFIVKETEGPLAPGEIERARKWINFNL